MATYEAWKADGQSGQNESSRVLIQFGNNAILIWLANYKRAHAVMLFLFRRVDIGKPDSDWFVIDENRHRVAVLNSYGLVRKRRG